MSSQTGRKLKMTLFGESHGSGVGCVLEGLPPGLVLDFDAINTVLQKRRPGYNALTSSRQEKDEYEIISGVLSGKTTGPPVTVFFPNTDVRPKDYEKFRRFPRPSHADYPAFLRYHNHHDIRGGGHFSARLTAPWCFAGALATQILKEKGVLLASHLFSVGNFHDLNFDQVEPVEEILRDLQKSRWPLLDIQGQSKLEEEINEAARRGDSVGGIVETAVLGLEGGLGNPIFDNPESRLAYDLFAIPGVKGVEFGSGFAAATMRGSRHNDPWTYEQGQVKSKSNHHGGVLGGITTGMPLIFRVAFKPTSSIALEQETVDLQEGKNALLEIEGRHDPCIALRGLSVVEGAAALVLADFYLNR